MPGRNLFQPRIWKKGGGKKFTYSLTAGVFGGDVEVDHVLTHDDVWNPITIVRNLSRPETPSVANQSLVRLAWQA